MIFLVEDRGLDLDREGASRLAMSGGTGCSHQTTLPDCERRAPQRAESWETTCRPRPFSASLSTCRTLGSAGEVSCTSHTSLSGSRMSCSSVSPLAYLIALVTSSETSSSVTGMILEPPALERVPDHGAGLPDG